MSIINLSISRDDEHVTNAQVVALDAIPDLAFNASQHFGSGRYVVRTTKAIEALDIPANEPLYALTAEWLEENA